MRPRATYTIHRDGPDRVTLRCTWCKRPSGSLPEARVSRWKDAHVCKTESKESNDE